MPISDRTRKLLWGRSGNRCALCRKPLAAEPTQADAASVVGDECHIVARSPGGPRAGTISADALDQEENLILLCKTDHKRVDDQPNYFTSERLRAIKVAHESWVHTQLESKPPQSFQAKIRRADPGSYKMAHITTGSEAFALVAGACAYSFDHDELRNQQEVDLVSRFLQDLQDYGEIEDDLGSAGQVEARYALSQQLKELEEADFWVYGAKAPDVLIANGETIKWPIARVFVKRASEFMAEIIKRVDEEMKKAPGDSQAPSEPAAQPQPTPSSPSASQPA